MNKTFRLILLFLLLPVMITVFYLETRLPFSSSGHALVQVAVVAGTCWLAWQWVIYDEVSDLREIRRSEPVRYHYRITTRVEDVEPLPSQPICLPSNGTTKSDAAAVTEMMLPLVVAPFLKKMNRMANNAISPARVVRALMSVGVVFALTVVMLSFGSKTLGEGVIAILYLVPIGWCTVRWGQQCGVSAALTAALSFDFLFIPPYGTFTIGSVEGWLLLLLFFATAILVVGRIQTIITEERERVQKATFLYEMVAAIANQATRKGIARAIANQIQKNFLAEGVQVQLSAGWGYPNFTAHAGNGQPSVLSEKPDRALTIVSGPAVMGEIDVWLGRIPLPADDDPMLQTMLNQTAAALERVRAAEGKAPYPK